VKVSIGSNKLPHFFGDCENGGVFFGVAEGSPPKTGETTLQGFEGSTPFEFCSKAMQVMNSEPAVSPRFADGPDFETP